jgi:hypothetical protein
MNNNLWQLQLDRILVQLSTRVTVPSKTNDCGKAKRSLATVSRRVDRPFIYNVFSSIDGACLRHLARHFKTDTRKHRVFVEPIDTLTSCWCPEHVLRFRKHQIKNWSPDLPLPTVFKTWFLLHKMWLKLAKIDQKLNFSIFLAKFHFLM